MNLPFTHPKLNCWICEDNPAQWLVEAKAPSPSATSPDETDSYYQLCCDDFACLILTEAWANTRDLRFADTRPLTRSEAEAITGDDLSEGAAR